MSLKIEQLYLCGGDNRVPSGEVVQDGQGRWLRFYKDDGKVTLGKLVREPSTVEGSHALCERCRKRSGVASITWYSWSRDVIEISSADLARIEDVIAAYKTEGYPIQLITY